MIASEAFNQAKIYDHLYKIICTESFLKMTSLGNEIPFYIMPFEPRFQKKVDEIVEQLVKSLAQAGITVLQINLYRLMIEILEREGDLDYYLAKEPEISKSELLDDLQGILDVKSVLVPAIAERMSANDFDVLFLTGVGASFPPLRSHNVLNNLQSTAKDRPTLMFFPGEYTHSLEKGASLDLFGLLHDDKYYRAFNILHRQA
jgi:hypothetical protein